MLKTVRCMNVRIKKYISAVNATKYSVINMEGLIKIY